MRRRPFHVTLLALLVLSLTALNGVRCGAALARREVLAEFAPQPGPWYLAATGLIWLLVGLVLYVGLAAGLPWARRAGMVIIPAYLLYYWLDRLLAQAEPPGTGWPFALVFSGLALALAAIALLSRSGRLFFSDHSTASDLEVE